MKLIIDVDEETYKKCKWKNNGVVGLEWWERTIASGTLIPDNATNGDIMQTIFPNADIEIHNITVYVIFDIHSNVIPFDLDWWNSPYQKGGGVE